MGIPGAVRHRFREWEQWSPLNGGRIGVRGVGRGLFRVGCRHRTRSLAPFAWREDQVRSDLIYGRWATGGCRGGWTGTIRVWAVRMGRLISASRVLVALLRRTPRNPLLERDGL